MKLNFALSQNRFALEKVIDYLTKDCTYDTPKIKFEFIYDIIF